MLEKLMKLLEELIKALNENTAARQAEGGSAPAKKTPAKKSSAKSKDDDLDDDDEEDKPEPKKPAPKKKSAAKGKAKSDVSHDDIRNFVRDQRAEAKEVSPDCLKRVKAEFAAILEDLGAKNISAIEDGDLATVLERAKEISLDDDGGEEDDDLD